MYEYWLASMEGISSRKKQKLRQRIGDAKKLFYIEEKNLHRFEFLNEKDIHTIRQAQKETNFEQEWAYMEKEKIRFLPWFSEAYPRKLLELATYPYAIYAKGHLPSEDAKKVAIVGARKCSTYGERHAMKYGQLLASYGVEIISGLARGIDGFGQRGALQGKGRTTAVLGCGVDLCYPREHRGLYEDILAHDGCILSELKPKTPPLAHHFPMRNRIISGLSDAVLVIEAKEQSGSLITADFALEQGRDVYALPGPVDSSLSHGCHQLIRQGAGILVSAESLLLDLQIRKNMEIEDSHKMVESKKVLETEEDIVYSCLDFTPQSVSRLVEKTNLPAGRVMEILISLELEGYIQEVTKHHYVRGIGEG